MTRTSFPSADSTQTSSRRVAAVAEVAAGGSVEKDINEHNSNFYRSAQWNFWKDRLGVPYFSNHSESRVISSAGQTTYLHCLVGNLGDRQVSNEAKKFEAFSNGHVKEDHVLTLYFIRLTLQN